MVHSLKRGRSEGGGSPHMMRRAGGTDCVFTGAPQIHMQMSSLMPLDVDGGQSALVLSSSENCHLKLTAPVKEDVPSSSTAELQAPSFRHEDVTDADFRREDVLGHGSYSVVCLVQHRPSRRYFALKEISRHRLRSLGLEEQLRWEINVHRKLRHPNIVRLYSYFLTQHHVNLVLELCRGGTLMSRVRRTIDGRLDEGRGSRYIRHVARALRCLHQHGLAHRDLKLENVLLDGHGVAKLADFGWSREMLSGDGGMAQRDGEQTLCQPNKTEFLSSRRGSQQANSIVEAVQKPSATQEGRLTVCGTLDYLSPEMLNQHPHTLKTDVWSLGIMMVEMLTGVPPFYHPSQQTTMDMIRWSVPNLRGRDGWSEDKTYASGASILSSEATELVLSMLRKDPDSRPTIEEVLAHPWLQKRAPIGEPSDL